MKRIFGVATIVLLTGGIVLAPTGDGDATPQVTEVPQVAKAARPQFLNRIGLTPGQRAEPAGPSDEEAIRIAMARGAELRGQTQATTALLPASLEQAAEPSVPLTGSADTQTSRPTWEVTGTRVNLRAGPGTAHQVVGQAQLGERMEPLGDTGGDWVQVRRTDGQEAWIFAKFLDKAGG